MNVLGAYVYSDRFRSLRMKMKRLIINKCLACRPDIIISRDSDFLIHGINHLIIPEDMSIRRYRSFNSKDMFHFASAVDTDQPDMSASSVDSSVAAPLTDSTLVAADALIDNSSNAMFK